MNHAEGQILEVRQPPGTEGRTGFIEAYITCPPAVIPLPGQYVVTRAMLEDTTANHNPLADMLFAGALTWEPFDRGRPPGFWAAPPLPAGWGPGTRLLLSGPRGVGFQIPSACRHLGVAALGQHAARLALVIRQALQAGSDVALFGELISPASLPPDVEVHPLSGLRDALAWMDFLALDLSLDDLGGLRSRLALPPDLRLPCPAQALIYAPMPCGGVGECGVCAAPARRGWVLPCMDGPVIDLSLLFW